MTFHGNMYKNRKGQVPLIKLYITTLQKYFGFMCYVGLMAGYDKLDELMKDGNL